MPPPARPAGRSLGRLPPRALLVRGGCGAVVAGGAVTRRARQLRRRGELLSAAPGRSRSPALLQRADRPQRLSDAAQPGRALSSAWAAYRSRGPVAGGPGGTPRLQPGALWPGRGVSGPVTLAGPGRNP